MSESIKKIGNMTVRVFSGDDVSLQENVISKSDAEMDKRVNAAVQFAIDQAKKNKKPIASYDVVTKRAYIEFADGSIQYVD